MTIVNKAAMTTEGSKPVTGRSRFALNQRIAGGYRFGLYQPCYAEYYNPNETIPVKSAHDVRSLNLKSPMLGNVSLHKDFFDVPMSVLLPLNYDKYIVRPTNGEDIDPVEVGLNVHNLPALLFDIVHSACQNVFDLAGNLKLEYEGEGITSQSVSDYFVSLIRLINILSLTFSAGSIFSAFGLDISACITFAGRESNVYSNSSVDLFIDDLVTHFQDSVNKLLAHVTWEDHAEYLPVQIDGDNFKYLPGADPDSTTYIDTRRLLERAYDASFITFDVSVITQLAEALNFTDYFIDDVNDPLAILANNLNKDLRLDLPFAYQCVCAEFYTNSRVDYMYTAQLFRQFVSSYLFDDSDGFEFPRETFSWNGVEYLYDFLSAHNISMALQSIPQNVNKHYQFLRLLFGYNRSLRYVDYFVNARPRPYPVLGVTTPVTNGSVRVIDQITTRWAAKWINQAYRLGRKMSEYMKGIFAGVDVKRDYHDPMWLGSISDMVDTPETSNTGAAQNSQANSVSSNFVSNGQRYAFEYDTPQYYGVVIGIQHFDIARYYPHVIERNNFAVSRDDLFQPMLQFVGDQPIYRDELYSGSTHDTFGYTGRDMQYKSKVDRCFGVFSIPNYLPGWLYVAPDSDAMRGNLSQNPSFIRAYPSELDKFFTALSGYSPATYFHFIVINTNDVNISREMIANPQID